MGLPPEQCTQPFKLHIDIKCETPIEGSVDYSKYLDSCLTLNISLQEKCRIEQISYTIVFVNYIMLFTPVQY